MTFTRKNYLDGDCTHRDYYAQFVSPGRPNHVAGIIGGDRLLASTDSHLNDIPLRHWDAIPNPFGTDEKMRSLGDYPTLSSAVCISKEAARQWIEAQA